MRAVWHLAINSLAGRRGRTALLITAVALATVLSVFVACVLGTLHVSYAECMGFAAGRSDLHIRQRSYERFDQRLLEKVRTWSEVELAAGRLDHKGVTLELVGTDRKSIVNIKGVEPDIDREFYTQTILKGRWLEADNEVVIDGRVQAELQTKIGDELEVAWQDVKLKVVGIVEQPPLTVMQLPAVMTNLNTAQTIAGYPDQLRRIDIKVKRDVVIPPGLKAPDGSEATLGDAVIALHEKDVPRDVVFESPANVRAGINRGVEWVNLIGQIVTVLVCLSTAFIIVTGLTTAVTERTRELAILRCVGTGRLQIGAAQVLAGLIIAVAGAAIGTPLGILAAQQLYHAYRDVLISDFVIESHHMIRAVGATLAAGVIGAMYPAFLAARVRPLEALAARARAPKRRGIYVCLVLGLLCIAFEPIVLASPADTELAFWIYLPVGLGLTFIGYCLLCVPLLMALSTGLCKLVSRVLKLPVSLLTETVHATPFRHGLTAGALMMGLAILVSIWTEGGNLLYGWFDTIKMPDAFVRLRGGFNEKMIKIIEETDGVTETCEITVFPQRTVNVQFGVKQISPPFTLFAACDVKEFVEMTDVEWIEGDKATALAAIEKGNAVLVGKEYLVAHGMGVGTEITLKATSQDGDATFDIVGVVGATGLDVAVAHYGIGKDYAEASISTVFGSRSDGAKYFGLDKADLVLLSLKKEADEHAVMQSIKDRIEPMAKVVVEADTSRRIRDKVHGMSIKLMGVASILAFSSLLIASVGVANLIVAEIHARRYEFGVLRAIGSQRGMLARFIAAQTLVIAAIACIAGTLLGIQIAYVGKIFHERLVGVTYGWQMPWAVILGGCAVVLLLAVAAAGPPMIRLMRKPTTQLLAADA